MTLCDHIFDSPLAHLFFMNAKLTNSEACKKRKVNGNVQLLIVVKDLEKVALLKMLN